MSIAIDFTNDINKLADADQLVVLGTKTALARPDLVALLPDGVASLWSAMLEAISPGDQIAATSTWLVRGTAAEPLPPLRVSVVAISDRVSRHNAPGRPDAVTAALKGRFSKGKGALLVALDKGDELHAVGYAVARAFPLYTRKKRSDAEATVTTCFVAAGGARPHDSEIRRVQVVAAAIREAARMTDMPASELSTDAFVDEALALAKELGLEANVMRMDALRERGMGGIAAVGQAARRGPALVHIRYPGRPEGGVSASPAVASGGGVSASPAVASGGGVSASPAAAVEPVAWVGKGIVYDTGGLSLKGKGDMPGMKVDMGGAAAVLQALRVAVLLGARPRIDVVLCLAENSVGPDALRPDDVITLYSGKTIEVNNTDAEGRLVLSDGVAYAARDLGAQVIVDLATLTGAQLVATGKLHAAIISNDDALERDAIAAGRRSGDLVFPLPYAPELFRGEFTSPVADLRNSVKDRMNAQSSCAAQFVAESLPQNDSVRWLHVDMAGPVSARDRATGYGVALLAELFVKPAT